MLAHAAVCMLERVLMCVHTYVCLFILVRGAAAIANCCTCLVLLLGVFHHLWLVLYVLESLYLLSAFCRKVAVQSHDKLLSSKYLLRFLDYHVIMLGKQGFWLE